MPCGGGPVKSQLVADGCASDYGGSASGKSSALCHKTAKLVRIKDSLHCGHPAITGEKCKLPSNAGLAMARPALSFDGSRPVVWKTLTGSPSCRPPGDGPVAAHLLRRRCGG
jgi:hypothetical protein